MNTRHQRTLEAIYATPTRANIEWASIEALFVAVGAEVEERAGSRVAVKLGEAVQVFHRPHPGKEAKKPTVRSVRDFLMMLGVKP